MKNMPLAQTVAPKIFRFTDIDAFRSSVRNLNVDFTPLARKISAEQIVLNLPGCDVNYTKSFPRILDAQLDPNCTLIGFTMDDGVPIRFNGTEEDRSAVVIGSGGAVYTQVERTPRQYASIVFAPEIEDRVGRVPAPPSRSSRPAHRRIRPARTDIAGHLPGHADLSILSSSPKFRLRSPNLCWPPSIAPWQTP